MNSLHVLSLKSVFESRNENMELLIENKWKHSTKDLNAWRIGNKCDFKPLRSAQTRDPKCPGRLAAIPQIATFWHPSNGRVDFWTINYFFRCGTVSITGRIVITEQSRRIFLSQPFKTSECVSQGISRPFVLFASTVFVAMLLCRSRGNFTFINISAFSTQHGRSAWLEA